MQVEFILRRSGVQQQDEMIPFVDQYTKTHHQHPLTSASVFVGGNITLASPPKIPNMDTKSASDVEKGKFLTKMTVVLRFTLISFPDATNSRTSMFTPSSLSERFVSAMMCVSPRAIRTAKSSALGSKNSLFDIPYCRATFSAICKISSQKLENQYSPIYNDSPQQSGRNALLTLSSCKLR